MRYVVLCLLLLGTVPALTGCSLLRLGTYETFDEWYVDRERDIDVYIDSIGVEALEGTFTGYVLNDLVLRTPVFVTYEATRTALIPVALPFYTAKCAVGSASHDNETGHDTE